MRTNGGARHDIEARNRYLFAKLHSQSDQEWTRTRTRKQRIFLRESVEYIGCVIFNLAQVRTSTSSLRFKKQI